MPAIKKQTLRKKRTTKKPRYESAWPEDDGIKINVYGKAKTGKTTLWATFPKPILAIICSGGKKPGELRSIDTPEYRKTITPKILREASELLGLLSLAGDYKTVVLDHASSLQDHILRDILDLSELPTQKSWGMATRQQYGECSLRMKESFRAILNLSCNVVIVAQEREFNTEGDNEDLLMPFVASALSPSVVGWLNPAVDYICQTFIRGKTKRVETKIGKKTVTRLKKVSGVEYCLRTGPHEVYTTGFRIPKGFELPDVIVDPTFDKINKLIKQGG